MKLQIKAYFQDNYCGEMTIEQFNEEINKYEYEFKGLYIDKNSININLALNNHTSSITITLKKKG